MTIEEEEFLNNLETIAIGRGGVSVEAMKNFKNYFFKLEKENIDLKKELEELKEKQKVDKQCEFCKLADLERENTDLKHKIEKMKCCCNCVNKREESSNVFCNETDIIMTSSCKCDKWD